MASWHEQDENNVNAYFVHVTNSCQLSWLVPASLNERSYVQTGVIVKNHEILKQEHCTCEVFAFYALLWSHFYLTLKAQDILCETYNFEWKLST